jgi:hypothetical protein
MYQERNKNYLLILMSSTMENGGSISLMQLKSQAPITPKASSDHQNPF